MPGELSEEDILLQADALADYLERGGNERRWLTSKGLEWSDECAVVEIARGMRNGIARKVE